jgi:hypothetical protein
VHAPLRGLAKLDDPVDDFLAPSIMDGDFEGALTLGSRENRQGKVPSYVDFWVWSFGGFQNLQHLVSISGRLEAAKQFLNLGFIGEEQIIGFICPESGFDRM